MKSRIILLAVLFAFPLSMDAQTKSRTTSKAKAERQKTEATAETLEMKSIEAHEGKVAIPVPRWSLTHGYMNDRPVYFPDYYLFYTPERGYIYWNEGAWLTSPTVPEFVKEVDLRRARVQIMDDEEGNQYPEKDFTMFRKSFPAERVEVEVPVPDDK